MRSTIAAALLTLALAVSGCITTQEQHERLQHRVSRIQQNQKEMSQEWDRRLDRMEARLRETVSDLEAKIENSTSPVQSTQANLWSEIRNLRQETAKLKGRMQSLSRQAKQTNGTKRLKELESGLSDLRNRLETMSSRLGLDSLANGDASPDAENGQAPAEEIPAKELYNRGLDSFEDREYERAINLWSLYIKKKPEGDLVPNAHFWQGEAYYQLEQYGEAALKYQKVVQDYPDSSKHPAALLKQGISFDRLGKKKPGRILLQRVVDNYPDSKEAKRAQRYLEKM